MTPSDRAAFIRANTRLQSPPHAPELQLWLADEITPIWRLTEEELGAMGLPPPFWAFAWAGGQALARYLLDNPVEVMGKRVLDLACGSGMVGIAAMRAGAAEVVANDIDDFCAAAVEVNAETNAVRLTYCAENLLDAEPPAFDLICAGDVCYEKPMAEKVLAWLAVARAQGARVLIGDPGRSYFPRAGLVRLAEYQVGTTRELEDFEVKRTGVWTFPA
jgi:predicted nicotinamide N-methyase